MITPELRLERLRELRRVMSEVALKPRSAYDIGEIHREFATVEAFADSCMIKVEDAPPCRTVACTAGWAALDPAFRLAGWEIRPDRHGFADVYISGLKMRFWEADDWHNDAVPERSFVNYFGLTSEESETLFVNGPPPFGEDATAENIVTYLDELIASYS